MDMRQRVLLVVAALLLAWPAAPVPARAASLSIAVSGATYRSAIVDYVNLLHASGMYAILDLHWNAAGTAQATGQQAMVDADHGPAFWSSVAATFKNDPAVLFDLYNEPEFISWSCWRDGTGCPV